MSKVINVEFGNKGKAESVTVESGLDPFAAAAEEAVGPFAALVKRRHKPTMFDFDWDPLVARIEVKGRGAHEDELDYTQAGREKFGEIFLKAFGFPRLPRTWSEMKALWDYCYATDRLARSGNGLVIMAETWPEQVPVMQAYLTGNRFELKRWHTEACLREITEDWVVAATRS